MSVTLVATAVSACRDTTHGVLQGLLSILSAVCLWISAAESIRQQGLKYASCQPEVRCIEDQFPKCDFDVRATTLDCRKNGACKWPSHRAAFRKDCYLFFSSLLSLLCLEMVSSGVTSSSTTGHRAALVSAAASQTTAIQGDAKRNYQVIILIISFSCVWMDCGAPWSAVLSTFSSTHLPDCQRGASGRQVHKTVQADKLHGVYHPSRVSHRRTCNHMLTL